jgi:O-antigen ligase
MRMPTFIAETLAQAKQRPLWGAAFAFTLLLPVMLIVVKMGIEICTAFIGLSFLWQSWRTKEWRWLRMPFTQICIITWLWLILVVTPFALAPREGMVEALVWFRLPLLFAALRYWVLVDWRARATLGVLLAGLFLLIAIDCFAQFFTGMSLSGHAILPYNRLSGPFRQPKVGIYLARLTVPVVAYCLATGLKVPCRRTLVMSLALLIIVIASIVLSGERSAFIGILLASVIALGLVMVGEKRLRIAGCIACAGTLALVALLYFTNSAIQERAAQMVDVIQHYPQSPYGLLAGAGFTVGEQHWLHGVGLNGFDRMCPTLVWEGREFRGLHPHNYYSEWFAEAGLPGLLLFISMLGCLAWEAVRGLRRAQGLARLVPAVAVGMLVQHFFPLMSSQSFFVNWGAIQQWYVLALIFAALPKDGADA